jgi:hypothetical protein
MSIPGSPYSIANTLLLKLKKLVALSCVASGINIDSIG